VNPFHIDTRCCPSIIILRTHIPSESLQYTSGCSGFLHRQKMYPCGAKEVHRLLAMLPRMLTLRSGVARLPKVNPSHARSACCLLAVESVHADYLDIFRGEFNDCNGHLTPEERGFFNGAVSSLDVDSNGNICTRSVVEYIKHVYPQKADFIDRSGGILEALINAHACFPFSTTVPLTRDALCRVVVMLTHRYKYSTGTSSTGSMRATTPEQRLRFMFSAIVHPSTGMATYDEMLDVILRLPYPTRVNRFKGYPFLRPQAQLIPVAERLEPGKPKKLSLGKLPISVLKPLEELTQAFKHSERPPHDVYETKFPDVTEVSAHQFVKWAKRVCISLDRCLPYKFETGQSSRCSRLHIRHLLPGSMARSQDEQPRCRRQTGHGGCQQSIGGLGEDREPLE
jgi:hypothetical protein